MEKNSLLKYAKQLEFDKVLARASDYAASLDAKNKITESQPNPELSEAVLALERCDEMMVRLSRNTSASISAVSDIPLIAIRAKKGGILSMGELLSIRAILRNARLLRSWYGDGEGVCGELFFRLFSDEGLERRIGDSILSETEMSDDASSELADIRKKIVRAEGSIRDKLDSIVRSPNTSKYLQDAVVTMRSGRYVVPVKAEHRNDIKGLVHDVSSSGSTFFVEPEAVLEANNKIMELKADEAKEIDRILSSFSDNVAGIADEIIESYKAFVEIDIIIAKAKYCLAIRAVKPVLNNRGNINLVKARHPLIPQNRVVPIDLPIGEGYSSLIITGPNTGGKTVTLKTVGLFTLMAMSGLCVPAFEGTELSVYREVLVDIGDEQSIEQSLSTFSGHIKNIAEILNAVDKDSLVLLDELGAGTDPAEGAALALAVLERLKLVGSTVIATTHYGEIKEYALQTDGVRNAGCEFDIKTLSPTYRVIVGVPGSSNALTIAKRLGLDEALIDRAKENMDPEKRHFEDLLAQIEVMRSEVADQKALADRELARAEEMIEQARAKRNEMLEEGKKHLEQSEKRASQLMADVESSAYRLLDEIKKLDKEKNTNRSEAAARAREIARRDAVKLMNISSGDEILDDLEPVTDVKKGDVVYLLGLNSLATVISPADKAGNVEVQAGLVKSRVSIETLRRAPNGVGNSKKKTNPTNKVSVSDKRSGKNEINLLGLTVEEAMMEVERFIDAAVLSHLSTVYLIHGKGTGALRKGIHQRLGSIKHVKAFRLGKYGEGEDGVTIVELK